MKPSQCFKTTNRCSVLEGISAVPPTWHLARPSPSPCNQREQSGGQALRANRQGDPSSTFSFVEMLEKQNSQRLMYTHTLTVVHTGKGMLLASGQASSSWIFAPASHRLLTHLSCELNVILMPVLPLFSLATKYQRGNMLAGNQACLPCSALLSRAG